jgi:glycosyltransferase involved in cell wall biosynthesis
MRVLYVENSYGEMGGSLVSLLQLSRQLVEQGRILPAHRRIEPCFYFLYPNLLLDEFRELGEVVLEREDYSAYGTPLAVPSAFHPLLARMPGSARKGLGEILPLAKRVAGHSRRLKVDLIHTNCRLGSNEYAILGAMLARVPVIAHERLLYRVGSITRPFAAAADLVVAISQAVADNLTSQGVRTKRLEVLHNGINTAELVRYRERARPAGAPLRIGMVGRITRWKGQHVFVDAARRVAEAIPDVEFHLAGDAPPGDGAYLESLRETVKDLGLEEKVIFHGNVKEIYDFMAGMDALAHCSVDPEPLGRVILEAMALGKPMVATRGGAVEEICTDGQDALVVDPGRPDLLAEALLRLTREPRTAERLGAEALRTIETRFSLPVVAARMRSLYDSVLTPEPARRRPIVEAITDFLSASPLSVRRRKEKAGVRHTP